MFTLTIKWAFAEYGISTELTFETRIEAIQMLRNLSKGNRLLTPDCFKDIDLTAKVFELRDSSHNSYRGYAIVKGV